MAETSAIEWTDSTFNPWMGCTKISPACDHCYAEALMDTRHHRVKWGGSRVRTKTWHEPARWQRQAAAFFAEHGRRQRVFCSSLADVFDNQVPDEWRDDLWALIRDTPALNWQLLTKRPQNIGKMLPASWDHVKGHVWLGATVEDQKRADLNIPHLLEHDCAVRFISAEPLLGPLYIPEYMPNPLWNGLDSWKQHEINWVIAGGESGPKARPSHPDWFRSLRDQCAAAGVPFLFKQWGEWAPAHFGLDPENSHVLYQDEKVGPFNSWKAPVFNPDADSGLNWRRLGKKAAGRLLDGVEHNGFPVPS